MRITMLGTGNGFSQGLYNSNALVEYQDDKCLIDCGVTAYDALINIGLSEKDINTIFITHLHFDHVGGLEAFAIHSKHFSKRKIRLVLPSPIRSEIWDHYLSGGLKTSQIGCSCLEDYFDVEEVSEGQSFIICNGVKAQWVQTHHVEGKFSCAILVPMWFAYTSDMVFNRELVESWEPKVKTIFHDCQIKGNVEVHSSLKDILMFKDEVKKKLVLIHYGDQIIPKDSCLHFAVQGQCIDLNCLGEKRADVESDMMIAKTIEHMKDIQSNDRSGHDWLHTKRVYELAMKLASKSIKKPDLKIVAMAALLHDIADWKFNNGDEEAGPKAASSWMRSCGASESMIEAVVQIILDLSFKGMAETKSKISLEGMFVQDADRLDAIGAIGIARAFATGAVFGNGLLDPDIPPRDNLTRNQYADRSVKSTTVNHFYEKLLNLKDLMNTEEGRRESIGRHRFMILYLQELYRECNMIDGIHGKLLSNFADNNS